MKRLLLTLPLVALLSSCATMSDQDFKSKMKTTLKDNPEIISDYIKENPLLVLTTLQEASMLAQKEMAKKQEDEQKKELIGYLDNPLTPSIRDDESFMGNPKGKITVIEYSDFQCPYCSRGAQTIKKLMDEHKGNIRVVFKHLPLEFHQHAMIAAKYYEAIRLQNAKKAHQFYETLFENQASLNSNGQKYLSTLAKKLKVNMKKLKTDLNSDKVMNRIHEDITEAKKFDIQGTPGFILNGVPIKGAYPVSHFNQIIDELKKRNKL